MILLPAHIQQFLVIGVTIGVVVLLLSEKVKPAFVFFGAVMIFVFSGIIGTEDLLHSLANESILSIFLLIFITAGIRKHFNIIKMLDRFFGENSNPKRFTFKMTSIVSLLSAFLNNTPIVALMMPYVYQWSEKNKIAPSKLLIPLSFAAMSGGMITVIGTSTNLVLNGLIISKGETPLGIFDFLWLGILVSVFGVVYLYFFGQRLLPDRTNLLDSVSKQFREYLIETKVHPGSILNGKSITAANLRNLQGLYLFEIVRNEKLITPVSPEEEIEVGDSLFFAGETGEIIKLLDRDNELSLPKTKDNSYNQESHQLIETVIPVNSNLINTTLKRIQFREKYDAAVVAIHRNGEKLRGKIGEISMQAGDMLLVSAGKNFHANMGMRSNLYFVSEIEKTVETNSRSKIGFSLVSMVCIALMLFGTVDLFQGLLLITSAMVVFRLLGLSEVKKSLDIDLLIILVSSLTFSKAMIDSGTAQWMTDSFLTLFAGAGNVAILIGLYCITLLLASIVTHVAAVSIVFPIAYALGQSIPGIDLTALCMCIAFAASASFHAPFSYQTNLMIYGPGGYKFKDFLKIGLPQTLGYSIITITFIVLVYKV